jgi:hypothetical protein
MRGNDSGRFLEALLAGDPVALTAVGILAALLLLFGLSWLKGLKVARDLRRNDEPRKCKRPGSAPKDRRP